MISVCLATFNGAKFIKEQIDSILPQLGKDDEVVVSDDGSTDSTITILQSYLDNRIRILHHKSIQGSPIKKAKANFENALNSANGDYIFLADQDDIWESNKIERILPLLEQYKCIQHNKSELYSNGIEKQCPPLNNQHTLFSAIRSMRFAGCCMAITKDFLRIAMPIPDKIQSHDGWLACLAIALRSYKFIDEPLLKHRIHGNNASIGTQNSIFFKLRYRFEYIIEILKRKAQVK